MKAILASQNAHKAEEFAAAVHRIEVLPAPHGIEVDENETSFIGNARLKARAYAQAFNTNALADDSGLCVDALNGAPGIHSQRFAILPPDIDDDPDRTAANNRKLLRQLANIPNDKRTAHFSCALCLVVINPTDIREFLTIADNQLPAGVEIQAFNANNDVIDIHSNDVTRVELTLEGQAPGSILHEKHGSEGFGYDPLFFCPETQCTFAELTREQKLSVSHRGRAIALLRAVFAD